MSHILFISMETFCNLVDGHSNQGYMCLLRCMWKCSLLSKRHTFLVWLVKQSSDQ